jgi:Tfp pilus assembly protein PilO
MFITSLGIFGFLSKAHLDQTLTTKDVSVKLEIYDEKIKVARETIDANRKTLKQLDDSVDQILARSTTEEGARRANTMRINQKAERTRIASDIETQQKLIATITEESAPIRAEVRKVEAEVGPLKYIAELIYGEEDAQNHFDAAVRWVIILLIIVFDPLAVLLVIAANYSLSQERKPKPVIKTKVDTDNLRGEFKSKKKKVDLTSLDPIPMNKDEIVNATKIYHRDQDSM